MKARVFALIGGLVGLLLVAGGAILFLKTHERVEREVFVPPTGEARANPYLAAERLLGELGLDVLTERRLDWPDPDDELILFVDSKREIGPSDAEGYAIWAWEGGHLVFAAPIEEGDPLVRRLDFTTADEAEAPAEEPAWYTRDYEMEGAFVTRGHPWRAPDVDWEATRFGGIGQVALSRPYGDGRLTLIADPDVFRNNHIGKARHATLLRDIVALHPFEEGYATIVLFGHRLSWTAHLVKTLWPAGVVLLIILLLALQAGRRRFGPLIAVPAEGRRSRVEHIEAMGRFMWNQGAGEPLLQSARQSFIDAVARRRPVLRTLRGGERDALIAEELNLSPDHVYRLLEGPPPHKPRAFFDLIDTLERYRRSL